MIHLTSTESPVIIVVLKRVAVAFVTLFYSLTFTFSIIVFTFSDSKLDFSGGIDVNSRTPLTVSGLHKRLVNSQKTNFSNF